VTPWKNFLERVACSDKIIVTVRMINSCVDGVKLNAQLEINNDYSARSADFPCFSKRND
jgi:hypothetical protein